LNFAIVDIETTGAFSHYNAITEVAVVLTDGDKILDTYESLIKPDENIPGFITALTGITDKMVEEAPLIAEVQNAFNAITKDAIFVAHNVGFDYGFLRKTLKAHGLHFYRKKLCTVRMAKAIMPNLNGYSLSKITHQLNICHEDKHRAMGDAMATYLLFKMLLEADSEGYIEKALKGQSLEGRLPANLPQQTFSGLPEETGIYNFHNGTGKIIYTGKANNIRQRIVTHLNSKSRKQQILQREVYNITYETTGSNLVAELLESELIKSNYPILNSAQKKSNSNYGIIQYEDFKGYIRLAISRNCKNEQPLAWFNHQMEARKKLQEVIELYKLCPKLCGLHKSKGRCFETDANYCEGACVGEVSVAKYNRLVKKAIKEIKQESLNLLIFDKGRTAIEQSVVAIEKGKYLGFGYLPKNKNIKRLKTAKQYINPRKDNVDVQRIIFSYLNSGKVKVVVC